MIKNVFDQIASFEGLDSAEHDSALGRRKFAEELEFWENREDNLHRMSEMLYDGEYPLDSYHTFTVYEPKLRLITSSDYTTKVIQRSIYNVLNPILSKGFIPHSYACIPERGGLYAGQRLLSWINYVAASGKKWYYLKADCAKFFYRIDQRKLMDIYSHKVADSRTLALLDHYTCHSALPFGIPEGCQNPMLLSRSDMIWDKGLAIGGGLSHMSGNVYLNELDLYAKRDLQIKYYIRYMDDIIVLMDDKAQLRETYSKLEEFLNKKLQLSFNNKTAIRPINCGVEFVGYVIRPHSMRLRKRTSLHMKRRLAHVQKLYREGHMTFFQADATVQSYKAMLAITDSKALDSKIFRDFVLTRDDGDILRDGYVG